MTRISALGLYAASVAQALLDFAGKRQFEDVGSSVNAAREYEADFATGSVLDASFTARPDAIVGRIAFAPGPTALQDITAGFNVKAWYARYDNTAGKVFYAESSGSSPLEWRDEVELFSFSGADIDAISMAFDATGRIVVAMERAGDIWVRYWDGAAYQLDDKGTGLSPALINQVADTIWGELYLIFEDGLDIKYRAGSDDYATVTDTLSDLGAAERIERVILDASDRIHLILSDRVASIGRYTLRRISSNFTPPCMDMTGVFERIDDGVETIFVFTEDAELQVTCELDIDVLLIGGGGDSGGSDGDPSTFWATAGGVALDPLVDTAPGDHVALGGGEGGAIDRDGEQGASGGGGGAQSPSNNSMRTAGGQGTAGQGFGGGSGTSSWGLLDRKNAYSGGGGGSGGPGEPGAQEAAAGGPGSAIADWNWDGPAGGNGRSIRVNLPETETGAVSGGGGAGGVRAFSLTIQPGQSIPIEIGNGGTASGNPGRGGHSIGGGGRGGMAAIRVRTAAVGTPAVLSGGTVITDGLYRYHIFTGNGTITIVTPGDAEALVVGGGGGGGSGSGGGGGGGDVRTVSLALAAASEAVTVGAGGAGGVAAAVGANGASSSIGILSVALGGGGGAGTGTAAGDGATGGGGHGADGDPGGGAALRGYEGGQGGGFNLSGGGTSDSAGGGGGAGGAGQEGAVQETQGLELAEDWDASTTFLVEVAAQQGIEPAVTQRALLSKNMSGGEMFGQVRAATTHNDAVVGIACRSSHPSGVAAAPDGYYTWFRRDSARMGLNATFMGGVSIINGQFYTMQLFVEDSIQEAFGAFDALEDEDQRMSATDSTHDGQDTRSFGPYSSHDGFLSPSNRRIFEHTMGFLSKYLKIGGISSGGKGQVVDADDNVIAEAVESGGEAVIDCSRYGDGATGVGEDVPLGGWYAVRVLDSGDVLEAENLLGGGVYPGAEFDVSGASIEYRESEPDRLIVGLVHAEDFSGLTPGPLNGDGGVGRELAADWTVAAAGDGGFFGGGGGGGAEIFVAGLAVLGGGSDGGVGATAVAAATAETGGGGGGSGDSSEVGGVGGSGVVVIRTLL